MQLLSPNDLPSDLRQRVSHQVLNAGQILVQQGEAAHHLYWVASGQLRLVSFVNQQMITHYFVEAGELFGESTLHFPTYGCTAIAEVPSEVIAIPKQAFINALRQSPALSERYLESLTRRFHAVKSLLELRSIRSARDRLLQYLLQRLPSGETTVILEKPLRAIASELALTPEALSRLLSRLQAEGIISRKKRSISFSQDWLEDVAK
ncbi:MAG: Crp/Fnr family transcriptional regulator [Synechococcales bacterium]|nr:Crp/Fnr family transcriptional regulator [Synechococcales bacterium]